MAALRSLSREVDVWDGEIDRILRRGIRNKWDIDALRRAQDRLNQAKDALRKKAAA